MLWCLYSYLAHELNSLHRQRLIILIKYDERLTVYQGLTLYIITNKLYAHREKNVVKCCMAIN
jgi:hypothetical protein